MDDTDSLEGMARIGLCYSASLLSPLALQTRNCEVRLLIQLLLIVILFMAL